MLYLRVRQKHCTLHYMPFLLYFVIAHFLHKVESMFILILKGKENHIFMVRNTSRFETYGSHHRALRQHFEVVILRLSSVRRTSDVSWNAWCIRGWFWKSTQSIFNPRILIPLTRNITTSRCAQQIWGATQRSAVRVVELTPRSVSPLHISL